jgi:hypothetical protein
MRASTPHRVADGGVGYGAPTSKRLIVSEDGGWSKCVTPPHPSEDNAGADSPGSQALAAGLQALRAVEGRFATTEHERRMLEAVRARLPDDLVCRTEGFVGHGSPIVVLGVHGLIALAGGVLGYSYPSFGALICLVALLLLVGEGTGRLPVLRWWLPRSPSYNLVVPPADPEADATGTVVLSTPLDIPRARTWRPSWLRRPMAGVLASTVLMSVLLVLRSLAEPWGRPLFLLYLASGAVLVVTVALAWVSRRESRQVRSDAGGVAVTLEVLRRLQDDPIPGLQVWTVFTGCGRAHQEGMDAFLSLRGARLPEPLFVLSLHEVARAPLKAVASEGQLWAQHLRPTGPALVERLGWSGVRVPLVDRAEPSGARIAMLAGYRSLCLTGGQANPSLREAERAAEVTETLMRWYAQDLGRVEAHRIGLTD